MTYTDNNKDEATLRAEITAAAHKVSLRAGSSEVAGLRRAKTR